MSDDEMKALHDRIRSSFKLSGADREQYPGLTWDQIVTVEDFDRLVAALSAHPAEEAEWEWSAQRDNALVPAAGMIYPAKSREDAERFVRENPKYEVRRRTPMVPAGPWGPAPEGSDR